MIKIARQRSGLLSSVVAVCCLAAVPACAGDGPDRSTAPPTQAAELEADQQVTSGMRGTVLRGPLTPGPVVGEDPDEAPFAAEFHVRDTGGNEVARFESDENGAFELMIAPGDYLVVPGENAPVITPEMQAQAVTVPPNQVVELVLRFDTGIR